MDFSVTDTASGHIKALCAQHGHSYVRLTVDGGGCSGFQYIYGFADAPATDDYVINGLVIDAVSQPFLEGSTLDYIDGLSGAHFKVINPNATSSCGCGTSFSV